MTPHTLTFWIPPNYTGIKESADGARMILRPEILIPYPDKESFLTACPSFIIKEDDLKATVVPCVFSQPNLGDGPTIINDWHLFEPIDLSLIFKKYCEKSNSDALLALSLRKKIEPWTHATLGLAKKTMAAFIGIPDEEKPAVLDLKIKAPHAFQRLAGNQAPSKTTKQRRMFAMAQSWPRWTEWDSTIEEAVKMLDQKKIHTSRSTFDKTRLEMGLPPLREMQSNKPKWA